MEKEITLVSKYYSSCVISGTPAPSIDSYKKLSIKHVNEQLNAEIQVDSTFLVLRGQIGPELHVVYVCTGYS